MTTFDYIHNVHTLERKYKFLIDMLMSYFFRQTIW